MHQILQHLQTDKANLKEAHGATKRRLATIESQIAGGVPHGL